MAKATPDQHASSVHKVQSDDNYKGSPIKVEYACEE